MKETKKKPVIVYLHRYPIEYESNLFPSLSKIFEKLSKKYDIVYISMQPVNEKNPSLRKGIKFEELPLRIDITKSKDKWLKTLIWFFSLHKVIFKVIKLKPSLIMCKEAFPFYPSILGRIGYPMMIEAGDWWLSGFFYRNRFTRYSAREIEKFQVKDWIRLKSFFVSQSEAARNFITGCGFPRERTKVFHYPLFEEVYKPLKLDISSLRNKLELSLDDFIIAVHGAILPSKGYDQLLDWWRRITFIHPGWKLLIIGGSNGEKWCRSEIKRLQIEKNVIMTGYLPTHQEVNNHLNAADCLLVTRRNTPDNQGITPSSLYHNLSVGKPTVATGLQGMSEVIQNKVNGYLFEPDNYDSFKSILEEIYANPKKARDIGKKGIKRGRDFFNPERSIKCYINAVESTIKYFSKPE